MPDTRRKRGITRPEVMQDVPAMPARTEGIAFETGMTLAHPMLARAVTEQRAIGRVKEGRVAPVFVVEHTGVGDLRMPCRVPLAIRPKRARFVVRGLATEWQTCCL